MGMFRNVPCESVPEYSISESNREYLGSLNRKVYYSVECAERMSYEAVGRVLVIVKSRVVPVLERRVR